MTSLLPCGWLLPRPAQGFSSESMSPQQVRFGKTLSANLVASPTPTSNGAYHRADSTTVEMVQGTELLRPGPSQPSGIVYFFLLVLAGFVLPLVATKLTQSPWFLKSGFPFSSLKSFQPSFLHCSSLDECCVDD